MNSAKSKKTGKKRTSRSKGRFLSILKAALLSLGFLFLLFIILAFTTLPFYARHRLGVHDSSIRENPKTIVLLGGSGIPGESGLIRCYYTAILASEYPDARVVIALPGDLTPGSGAPFLTRNELVMRGVNPDRIMFENKGSNTRHQALNLAKMVNTVKPVTLVTSPEHTYRSVLAFRKAGFTEVSGFPTFGESLSDRDMLFNDRELKGNRTLPPIGKNLQLRYQFWNHLEYEIVVLREYAALAYYRLRGWI